MHSNRFLNIQIAIVKLHITLAVISLHNYLLVSLLDLLLLSVYFFYVLNSVFEILTLLHEQRVVLLDGTNVENRLFILAISSGSLHIKKSIIVIWV